MIKKEVRLIEPMRWDDLMAAASVLYHRTNDLYVQCAAKREACQWLLMDLLNYWQSWMLFCFVAMKHIHYSLMFDAVAHRYQIIITWKRQTLIRHIWTVFSLQNSLENVPTMFELMAPSERMLWALGFDAHGGHFSDGDQQMKMLG